ncbi:lipase family protein (plasmid) [Bradyrhizobium sp. PMVTL-01]|uniref:lipase family protein n=1 Tax=Bradyrhizobium sp. PMVTL-01 TaxID=3434999 RepID=UPI003F71C8E4
MSAHPKQHWPPDLSPRQSEAVPTLRAAYSDRISALMALFCELAHDTFVADQWPAEQAGAPTVAGEAGRDELKRRLDAGSFRLVQVFNKNQGFLAVREGYFAVLVFRGTEGKELLETDLNLRLVPLPGKCGVMVHCGFLEVFSRCKTEIEAAVNESVPSTLAFYITGHSLGGALAQIASAALNRDNLAACYTFGSPRVGTAGLDEQVKCPHYRVINNWDLVPGLPLGFFRGYRHNGDPRLLTPKASFALRRDRYADFLYNIAAIVFVTLRTSKLLINDDHMIWNYRRRLEEIAMALAPAPMIA